MNSTVIPITWITLLQIFAVFLGHAAGILGKSWREKVQETDILPGVTTFYVHYGLWLLILPIAWFLIFIIKQNSPASQPQLILWILIGILILAGIGITGAAALLATIPSLIY